MSVDPLPHTVDFNRVTDRARRVAAVLDDVLRRRAHGETVDDDTVLATHAELRPELDEALRSLGLRPRATSMQGNAGRDDKSQGYKESRRTSPPPEYAEQYKAYTQGTAKGGK